MPRDDLGQVRRDSPANWNSENPVLSGGEVGAAINVGDEPVVKIGDGVSDWSELKEIGYGKENTGVAAALIADLPDLTFPVGGGLWMDTTDPDNPLALVRGQYVVASGDVANTTTETTNVSYTIDDFQINDTINIVILGGLTNNVGSNQNCTIRIKMTGVTLAFDFTAIPTSASARSIFGTVTIAGADFLGLRAGAAGRLNLSGAGSTGADFGGLARAVLVGSSALTAGDPLAVTLTVQHGSASANLTARFAISVTRARHQP